MLINSPSCGVPPLPTGIWEYVQHLRKRWVNLPIPTPQFPVCVIKTGTCLSDESRRTKPKGHKLQGVSHRNRPFLSDVATETSYLCEH